MTNIFTAVIHKEDELYVATCTETGNTSQGESGQAPIFLD
jgi:hypothetical protein